MKPSKSSDDFDSKRLKLYKMWHEYLSETMIHTADEVKRLSDIGDLEGVEARCAELLGHCKSLRSNGDKMAQIELSKRIHQ